MLPTIIAFVALASLAAAIIYSIVISIEAAVKKPESKNMIISQVIFVGTMFSILTMIEFFFPGSFYYGSF
jgi:multisubunit Na+/H+ antiporter MnhB subunit